MLFSGSGGDGLGMGDRIVVLLTAAMCSIAFGDMNDGLIAYYPFGGDAVDVTGNGHDGIVHGATLGPDRFGNAESAYSFDGYDDYIELGNTDDFGFANSSFSVSAWIMLRLEANQLHRHVFAIGDEGELPSFSLARSKAGTRDGGIYTQIGKFTWQWHNDVAGVSQAMTTAGEPEIPRWQWMHLASVVDRESDELRLYMNGIEQGTDRLVDFDLSTASLLTAFMGKTGFDDELYGDQYWNGWIDDLRIYDRALTKEEIAIYQNPLPGAAILGMLGLTVAGVKLRKFA